MLNDHKARKHLCEHACTFKNVLYAVIAVISSMAAIVTTATHYIILYSINFDKGNV